MISRLQLMYLSEDIEKHLIQHGSFKKILETSATVQGIQSGVQQDLAKAHEHRGKLGLGAGALGALYLTKKGTGKSTKEIGEELKKGAAEATGAAKETIKKAVE